MRTAVISCTQTTLSPLPKPTSQLHMRKPAVVHAFKFSSVGASRKEFATMTLQRKTFSGRNRDSPFYPSSLQVPEDGAIRGWHVRLIREPGYHQVRLGRENGFCVVPSAGAAGYIFIFPFVSRRSRQHHSSFMSKRRPALPTVGACQLKRYFSFKISRLVAESHS